MSIISIMAEGLADVLKIDQEQLQRNKARKEQFFKEAEDFEKKDEDEEIEVKDKEKVEEEDCVKKVDESSFFGELDPDGVREVIEQNRGRPAGARFLDRQGLETTNMVIAQPFQGGALTALSRTEKSIILHVYRLDISLEIVTEINYDDFTNALYSLPNPVDTPYR